MNGIKLSDMAARIRPALLASTLLCGFAVAAPAFAQAEEGGDIIVTGSRLIRTDLTAPSPITVVSDADIKMSGNVTIESTLNQFPQLAGGNSSSVNNGGGSGVLSANLRGLGPTRTLVLVNGRRFIPANSDGLVDLATIPDALIQRVEIITGGASAVYGSDAVAGAVNFILKKNFDGLEASYQYGQTTRSDGASHKADITFGTNFADNRGNVVFSASYTKRDEVLQADRGFAQVPLDTVGGKLVPGGSGNVPGTRVGLSATQLANLQGINLTPSGSCSALTGIVFGENGVPQPYCTPESAYNYAPFNYLLRPLERIQVSALAHYEVADNIEAFAEVYYANTRNESTLAPDSFVPITPGGPSSTLLVPNYANSPVLSPATRQFFVDNAWLFDPNGTGTASVVGGGRRASELGTRDSSYERNAINLTGGLRGQVDLLGSQWHWEAFYQYQRNRTDNRTEGMISQARLAQGLDAITNGAGEVVCRNQSLGCVPVNVFGIGSITPAAGKFLTPPRVSDDRFVRQVAGASLSGVLFELPAGPVSVALGTEYRKDSYLFHPSPLDLAGEYGPVSQSPISGSFNLKEIFGELRVPILADMPFAQTLAVEGAARYSDYSNIGSVFTWKLGGEYAPVKWVRFRSAYNVAIRAPSLNELYAPSTQGFTSGTDPCAVGQNPTAAQKQFCVSQGVPAADIDTFTQSALGFSAVGGGNPNLSEEKSKTLTIGAVVSPPFLDRLNLTVDYFKVKVSGGIAAINANQTISDCYRNMDANSPTCRAISRLPNGQVNEVKTFTNNLAAIKAEGLDAQIDYRIPLGGFLQLGDEPASLMLQAVGSWLFEESRQVLVSQPPIDCAGHFGNGCIGTGAFGVPAFKLSLSGTYTGGPLTFRAESRMIDGFKLYPGFTAAVQKTSPQWYVDLSATVKVMEHFELFGGLDNLFDKTPPILGTALAGDANTDPSLWDVVGRRFFVGGRVTF